MDTHNHKAKYLRYPGQPDNVTPDELKKYFKELAERQARTRRFP